MSIAAAPHDPPAARRAAEERSRGGWLTLVATALCVAAFLAGSAPPVPQSDDAYISYRYAQNLVAGDGLVFNAGERVEGYTNLSWVLLVAGALALGVDAPTAGHAFGLASGAAALVATAVYAWALLPRTAGAAAGVAPWLVLASTPFVRWSTSGLETPLFAAATTFALAAAARQRSGAAAGAAALATATRPEGMLVAALALAPALIARPFRRRAWLTAVGYAGFVAALTAFRLAYYGAPLPNTFYAKVAGVPWSFGLAYLGRFLAAGAALLLPAAAFAALRIPAARPGAALVLGFSLYVVAVGGDALGLSRLLVPVVPALAALAVAGTALAWRASRAFGVAAAVSLAAASAVAVLGLPTSVQDLRDALRKPERVRQLTAVRNRSGLFEQLAVARASVLEQRHGEARPLVAAVGIGALGYHADVRVLDLLGLTDATIAHTELPPGGAMLVVPGHHRSNTEYVFAREPDYIVVPRRGTPGVLVRAVHDIWQHPALEREYVWDPEVLAYRRRP